MIVLEADDRYGGRSLTLRPDDPTYRDWWFNTYNPLRLFERMYVSSKQERNNSPAPDQETASFKINKRKGGNQPVELYLGPGASPASTPRCSASVMSSTSDSSPTSSRPITTCCTAIALKEDNLSAGRRSTIP